MGFADGFGAARPLIDLDTGCVRRSEGARVVRAYTRGVEGRVEEVERERERERRGMSSRRLVLSVEFELNAFERVLKLNDWVCEMEKRRRGDRGRDGG